MVSEASGPDPAPNDAALLLAEWQECRTTIGRFDGIIIDLRKYGFTLITALIGAETFLFAQVQGTDVPITGKLAVLIVTEILIWALAHLDHVHEAFLMGAVDRAKFLEKRSGMYLSFDITKYSVSLGEDTTGSVAYSLFLLATLVAGLVSLLNSYANGPSNVQDWLPIVALAVATLALWGYLFWSRTMISRARKVDGTALYKAEKANALAEWDEQQAAHINEQAPEATPPVIDT